MPRHSLTFLLLFALTPALAQAEPTTTEIAHARRLFAEAVVAEESKDWSLAEAKLRDAIAIKETAGLRFHLAHCHEQQGQLVEALAEYDRSAELAEAEPKNSKEVRRLIGPTRDKLRRRIPTITVELPAGMIDATLRLNDRTVSPSLFGKPIPQNPGEHRLVVSTPGHAPFIRDIVLAEGDTHLALVEPSAIMSTSSLDSGPLGLASQTMESSAPKAEGSTSSNQLRNWVLLAEGAITTAALGVGIGYQLSAASADHRAEDARASLASKSGSLNAKCDAPSPSIEGICDDLARAVGDGKSQRTVATIGFVSAGVGTAALVATWLFWPSASPSAATTVTVLPTTAHGNPALTLTGVF